MTAITGRIVDPPTNLPELPPAARTTVVLHPVIRKAPVPPKPYGLRSGVDRALRLDPIEAIALGVTVLVTVAINWK